MSDKRCQFIHAVTMNKCGIEREKFYRRLVFVNSCEVHRVSLGSFQKSQLRLLSVNPLESKQIHGLIVPAKRRDFIGSSSELLISLTLPFSLSFIA